jgi:hypothetical protein
MISAIHVSKFVNPGRKDTKTTKLTSAESTSDNAQYLMRESMSQWPNRTF